MGGQAAERALSGIRVLDVTQHESGPTCAQLLGWLGADVIKVETPVTGDPGRKIGSPLQTSEPDPSGFDAWYFLMHNSNKRGLTLNLKDPRGHEIFVSLVEKSDVVIENMKPGTFERLGLNFDVLHAANPAIILGRIKGYGLSGPYSGFGSFDSISQAAGGMFALTGHPDGLPIKTGPSVADSASGAMCALGIVAALYQRTSTGQGQQIEISMQEVVMSLTRGRFSDYYQTDPRRAPTRRGNSLTKGVPSGLFPSKGGGPNDYVYMIVNTALQPRENVWETFLRAIEREDLIGDERYATPAARLERREEVDGFVTDWTMRHTKYEVMERLAGAGILCSGVLDIADQLDDAHLNARGAIIEYEHPTRGVMRVPAAPLRMSASSTETRRPPLLGEHTDEILTEILGYDQEAIGALRAGGVV